jgi:hypothetical protein
VPWSCASATEVLTTAEIRRRGIKSWRAFMAGET